MANYIIGLIIILLIVSIVRNKIKHPGNCSSCSGCAMAGRCPSQREQSKE